MVPLRDSLMRKRSSPAGPLSRKRAPSASPTKPQPQSYSRADTFILRVGRAGYEIEYSPAWSIEHAAARFLTTYSLGCEWRTRVEGMLREQVVPEVERALEWSRRSQSSKSKENFRQAGVAKRVKLADKPGIIDFEAERSHFQLQGTYVGKSHGSEDAEGQVGEEGGSEWRMDVEA